MKTTVDTKNLIKFQKSLTDSIKKDIEYFSSIHEQMQEIDKILKEKSSDLDPTVKSALEKSIFSLFDKIKETYKTIDDKISLLKTFNMIAE